MQALVGLSRCDTVKQIVSKLPLFNSAQLQRKHSLILCNIYLFFISICIQTDYWLYCKTCILYCQVVCLVVCPVSFNNSVAVCASSSVTGVNL